MKQAGVIERRVQVTQAEIVLSKFQRKLTDGLADGALFFIPVVVVSVTRHSENGVS